MYFLLSAVVNRFCYLGMGLGIVLAFIGLKMLLSGIYAIPIGLSLAIVAAILDRFHCSFPSVSAQKSLNFSTAILRHKKHEETFP